jgi:hypothetical protein
MFHIFNRGLSYVTTNQARHAGSGLLFNAIICILFSLAVFANPDLLAFLVASFLMVIGLSLLYTWWRLQKWK